MLIPGPRGRLADPLNDTQRAALHQFVRARLPRHAFATQTDYDSATLALRKPYNYPELLRHAERTLGAAFWEITAALRDPRSTGLQLNNVQTRAARLYLRAALKDANQPTEAYRHKLRIQSDGLACIKASVLLAGRTLGTLPTTGAPTVISVVLAHTYLQQAFTPLGYGDVHALINNLQTRPVMLGLAVALLREKGAIIVGNGALEREMITTPSHDRGAFYNNRHTMVLLDKNGQALGGMLAHEAMHFILKVLGGDCDPAYLVAAQSMVAGMSRREERELHHAILDDCQHRRRLDVRNLPRQERVIHRDLQTGVTAPDPNDRQALRMEHLARLQKYVGHEHVRQTVLPWLAPDVWSFYADICADEAAVLDDALARDRHVRLGLREDGMATEEILALRNFRKVESPDYFPTGADFARPEHCAIARAETVARIPQCFARGATPAMMDRVAPHLMAYYNARLLPALTSITQQILAKGEVVLDMRAGDDADIPNEHYLNSFSLMAAVRDDFRAAFGDETPPPADLSNFFEAALMRAVRAWGTQNGDFRAFLDILRTWLATHYDYTP